MVKKYYAGLTLIELIVVLAILAILIALVVITFQNQLFKGNDAKRKADINRIKIAVEEYEKDHDCYPLAVVCKPVDTGLKPYLDRIPCDPVTGASYFYEYQDSVCPGWYRIYTVLENTRDSAITLGLGPNGAFNFVMESSNAPSMIVSTPSPTPSGSGAPGPTSTPIPQSGYYGCKSGICVPISWDTSRPGPECDPNYQNSSCYNQCGSPGNECIPWH